MVVSLGLLIYMKLYNLCLFIWNDICMCIGGLDNVCILFQIVLCLFVWNCVAYLKMCMWVALTMMFSYVCILIWNCVMCIFLLKFVYCVIVYLMYVCIWSWGWLLEYVGVYLYEIAYECVWMLFENLNLFVYCYEIVKCGLSFFN
jgi:hypothetical protein